MGGYPYKDGACVCSFVVVERTVLDLNHGGDYANLYMG